MSHDGPMIETVGLSKSYRNVEALRDLNLTIDAGDVYGFIGPNGAGKTTTIKILATLLRPSKGEARVGGYSVRGQSREIRRIIGYMPDSFGVYEDMQVGEYLEFFAAAYRITGVNRRQTVDDVLELTDLSEKRRVLVQSLSRGMQQRLGLARVLLHDPKVLLLDEPASGLDPRARVEVRELLKEMRDMGKTILISSHILSELAELCNKVGIIETGDLLFSGTIDELHRAAGVGQILEVRTRPDMVARACEVLKADPRVARAEPATDEERPDATLETGDVHVELATLEAEPSLVPELLVGEGVPLVRFSERQPTLEEVFMKLTRGVVS